MRFDIKTITDQTGYITDVFLSDFGDNDHILGDWHHPARMNILELEKLFETIEPVVKAYRKWNTKYQKGLK